MGKATILENLGEGYYKIRVSFDNRLIEAQKNAINEKLSKIDAEITALTNTRQYWEDDFNYRKNWLLAFMESHTNEEYLLWMKEIELAQTHLMESRLWLDKAKKDESLARLNKIKYQKELAYLTKYCPDSIEAYAWCVAYNEDLTGEVATIEIDYHIKRDLSTQQILNHSVAGAMGSQTYMDKTGFWLFDGAGTVDSILQHPLSSSAHAVWFNVCMLPAIQCWKGRFRIAIIERINYEANTCDVGIFGAFGVNKFEQNLLDKEPIVPHFELYNTQQNRYRNVPIVYMGSGAETFLVGDLVILDLHKGVGDPTVIGYYENPRQGGKVFISVGTYSGEISGTGVYTTVMNLKFAFSGSSSSWRYSQTSYTNGGSATWTANHTKSFTGLPGTCWIDSSIAYSRTYTETGVYDGRSVTSTSTGSSTITIACYVNSQLLHTIVLAQTMSGNRSLSPGSYANTSSRITYALHSMEITNTSIIYDITRVEQTGTGYYSSGNKISYLTKTARYKLKYSVSGGEVILDLDGNVSSIEALTTEVTTVYSDGYSYMDNGKEFTTDQGATTSYTQTFDGLAVLGHEFTNTIPI